MRLFLAASLIALAASPAWASDWDFRTGSFGIAFCGAPATFEVERQLPDAWVFRGNIRIHDTNEYDAIRIDQYDDNSLRITRELQGAGMGQKQTVRTDPPVIEEGMVVFYSQTGRGPGCNNPGANTALRMPLLPEPQAPTYEFEEFEVVGQSPEQCQASMALCTNSIQATFGANAQNVIAGQCTPRFQACMGNAQAAAAEYEEEIRVVGKTHGECMSSNQRCEARMLAYGTSAQNMIAAECAPRLAVCMNEAARTAGGGGGGGGGQGTIVADVTGYDSWDDPQDKCYLVPGSAVILLGTKPGDPNWKHLQGVEEVCDGEDFYLYDEGQLSGL